VSAALLWVTDRTTGARQPATTRRRGPVEDFGELDGYAGGVDAGHGTVIAGRYELVRELARGGMGSVWLATHQQLDTSVAIKFMDPSLASNDEARARFEREAKAAAKLRSPHVVQILDYGVDGGTPFIVMELLRGEDLRARLKRKRRLSLVEAAAVVTQACKALRLAADAGIVHRDLKPGNIFLAESGDDETVKILDFGVAKATKKQLGAGTTSGMLLGSPHFMSPEQARGGRTVDHRSDLWAMGVIIYRLLTGRKPFEGKELGDVIVKICTEPPPPVLQLAPELPVELEAFFARALSKEPEERFQSAGELARAFSTIVAAQAGLPASSDSFSGRFRPVDDEPEAETTLRSLPPSADAAAGTLTLATSSLMPSPEPARRYRVPLTAAAILLVVATAGLFWKSGAGERRGAEPAAKGDDMVPSEPRSATSVAAAPPERGEEPLPEAREDPPPPTPATASAVPSAKPLARPRKSTATPAPPPAKPGPVSGKDPILGF
jgi:eukaryotic-like serine/threonine-protein kinase